jgi:hypothetical protein
MAQPGPASMPPSSEPPVPVLPPVAAPAWPPPAPPSPPVEPATPPPPPVAPATPPAPPVPPAPSPPLPVAPAAPPAPPVAPALPPPPPLPVPPAGPLLHPDDTSTTTAKRSASDPAGPFTTALAVSSRIRSASLLPPGPRQSTTVCVAQDGGADSVVRHLRQAVVRARHVNGRAQRSAGAVVAVEGLAADRR